MHNYFMYVKFGGMRNTKTWSKSRAVDTPCECLQYYVNIYGSYNSYRGGQHFAHKNTKVQFFVNKYAMWFHKSYQNEMRFLNILKYIL